jgi:hypothetical protein
MLLAASCSKKFINEKTSSQYELADELNKLADLLKNDELMAQTPVLPEQSADNYYFTEHFYKTLTVQDQNVYTWKKDVFEGKTAIADWDVIYRQVFTCNLVLESLKNIKPGFLYEQTWNEIKGTALFMRAYAFYNLSQVFARVYDAATAENDAGVAMPLEADTEKVPARSSMKATYSQIIADLNDALPLVSTMVLPTPKNIANKPAVFALLARIYLSMRAYTTAGAFADSSLYYHNSLISFHKLSPTAKFPVAATNEETLYQSWMMTSSNVIQGKILEGVKIDSVLYGSYDVNDLRRKVYFINKPDGPIFNTSYTGKTFAFSGLAVDENYLIRAECNARLGKPDRAMADLNLLLTHRYALGTAPNYIVSSGSKALELILKERRKELVFRGQRWTDIQRLNKEEANEKIVPKRKIEGQFYQLLPLSVNYALPIPDDALREKIILQNERQ